MKNYKKLNISGRILCCMLLLCMILPFGTIFAFAAEDAGQGIEWSLDGNTLTISGSGDMRNFTENDTPPWHKQRDKIRAVIVKDGVTSIGDLAFYKYENIVSVTLAPGVKSVGAYAFSGCKSLEMISFGGIEVISRCAFKECESLKTIRLPRTLREIGEKAFYRCSSLESVTIPSSVQYLGERIFTYCDSLIGASVQASVDTIPEWMFYSCPNLSEVVVSGDIKKADSQAFYGCDSLTSVYYPSEDKSELVESIKDTSIDTFTDENVRGDTPTNDELDGGTSIFEDNKLTYIETTVKENNGSIISTVVTETSKFENSTLTEPESKVSVEALIDGESGWDELLEKIWKLIDSGAAGNQTVYVFVNLQIAQSIPSKVLNELAGKKVQINVKLTDGSEFGVDCERIDKDSKVEGDVNLGYEVKEEPTLADKYKDTLEGADTYEVKYDNNIDVNFSSGIYVGKENTHSIATIYKVNDKDELERLQSAVVDKDGNATFYLGSVTTDTKLVLGVNVKGETIENAIIPDEMAVDQYGLLDRYKPIEYAITAEREFLGMNSGQFALAVFGVIALIVVVVSVISVVIYRKKRLELLHKMKGKV